MTTQPVYIRSDFKNLYVELTEDQIARLIMRASEMHLENETLAAEE